MTKCLRTTFIPKRIRGNSHSTRNSKNRREVPTALPAQDDCGKSPKKLGADLQEPEFDPSRYEVPFHPIVNRNGEDSSSSGIDSTSAKGTSALVSDSKTLAPTLSSLSSTS